MEGNYEFVSPEWDDISEQAKDLVRTIMLMNCCREKSFATCSR